MSGEVETRFTVIFDSSFRVLKLPRELGLLLGVDLETNDDLSWQSLVVEDSSAFIPDINGGTYRRSGYLKRSNGEILEADFRCDRIDFGEGLFCAEIRVEDAVVDSPEPIDQETVDFFTTVSHELRVALNGVIGFANVLGGSNLDSDQRKVMEKLQSCNHMLKSLINDILEYSRLATSEFKLRTESVQIAHYLSEVVGLFQERARKKGLELKLDLQVDSDFKAVLPRIRVTQVLSNLISNAIKFTEVGWVSLSVCRDGDLLQFGVKDTGPGVEPNAGESVFKPFFQIGSLSQPAEGTGLGLAISRELASKMGGTLELHQPDGGGCHFEFTLPLQGFDKPPVEGELEKPSQVSAIRSAAKKDEPKHLMVVEDNQLNADILGHFLQDYGVTHDRVDNGKLAVEMYQDSEYDLILMDVMLPEMNGYEATEQILRKSKLVTPVPIVGVTAKVFRRDQARCLEAGMVEVVHKPVDFKKLREILDRYLYEGDGSYSKVSAITGDGGSDSRHVEDYSATIPRSHIRDSMNANTLEAYIERMKTPDTTRDEIISTAMDIVDAEVESLVASIERNDRKDIGMRAHSLKGALALLGARNILDLAKGLELIASDGRSPLKTEHWKDMIKTSYTEFKNQLNDYMRSTLVD